MTTIANTFAAKLAVAFVAVAMMISIAAPAQAAAEDELQAQIDALMATIAGLQAQLGVSGGDAMTSSASVCPYTWTRTLNMGSTGPDVKALQQFLNADAATAVAVTGAGSAGNETEYYGPATGAAVAKFQEMYRAEILSPLGLVNSTTFFGNSTMAQANALCVAAPVETETETETGTETETETETEAGSGTLGNDEGDLTNLDETAADESSIEEGEEVGLFAFTAEVEGDVEVNRIDVYMENTAAGTESSDAADYFQGASLWVDGDKVADLDVADWDEDTAASYGVTFNAVTGANDIYRLRFTGVDLVFADGDEPEFQIALDANNVIDSGDIGEIWGFELAADSIRFVDGQGFTDTVGDAAIDDTFTVAVQTVAALEVIESDNNPKARTIEVSDTASTDGEEVFMFEIEETEGIDVTVQDLSITVTTTGTGDESAVVEQATLKMGSTVLGSESVPNGGLVLFENLDLDIDADETVELTVELDFADSTAYNDGDTVTVALTDLIDYVDANGNDENDFTETGSATSNAHTLREVGVIVSLVSESVSAIENDVVSTDDAALYTIVFDVQAFGDTLYLPFGSSRTATTADGVTWEILDDDGVVYAGGTTTPSIDVADSVASKISSYKVGDGSTERFTLTVTLDPAASGSYKLRVKSINWATTDTTTTSASQNVEAQDIDTAKETITS